MSNAATLRAALKSAGYNPRRVTVRDNGGTTETSLTVTIRDASVSITKVREIVVPFERVRRDERSGEILAGGNTFVRVEYHDAVVDPITTTFHARIVAAAVGEIVQLDGGFSATKVDPRNATYPDEVELSGPGFGLNDRRSIACGLRFASERLAIAYLDAQASTVKAA
jgi:hypothetical protein